MSVQPPGKVPGAPTPPPSEDPLQTLKTKFANALDQFTSETGMITNSPGQVDNPNALGAFADAITALAGPAHEAANLVEVK